MALTDRPFICKNEQEVLCLHEVETLLRFFSDEDFAKVRFLGFGMHICVDLLALPATDEPRHPHTPTTNTNQTQTKRCSPPSSPAWSSAS